MVAQSPYRKMPRLRTLIAGGVGRRHGKGVRARVEQLRVGALARHGRRVIKRADGAYAVFVVGGKGVGDGHRLRGSRSRRRAWRR